MSSLFGNQQQQQPPNQLPNSLLNLIQNQPQNQPAQNQPQSSIFNPNPNQQPNQRNQEEDYKLLSSRINNQLKSFDSENPKGIMKQSLKDALGLNFTNFNNSYSRNLHNFSVDKIYILSHNLRTNIEKNKIPQPNFDFSKINARKFEQISNNILGQEKDYFKQFIENNGDIGLNDLNNINNITNELKKINANNPSNYMQENPDFDFNNNKLGIYLLLQQDGKSGKIYDNGGLNKNIDNGLKTKNKRCNEHMRRRMLKNKDKKINLINQDKLKSFNNIIFESKNIRNSTMNMGRYTYSTKSGKDLFNEDERNSINMSYFKPKKNYLIEEERDLFEKYFFSLIPYFRELISEKDINTSDKILKLKEVLDINISTFREGRRNFCEFIKSLITPSNTEKDNNNKLSTKNLILRVIKYLEKDYQRKNYGQMQSQSFQRKEDFITNYSNNIIYTYFSNLTSQSQSKTLILWAKIYFYIRFGWKKECIEYINKIDGIYISETGLREIKESLDENRKINLQNYNEFKRILNQEKKEENPFKHACMVYMTKIADQLCDNILIEINDHLWFNLNLIYPGDNYAHLIKINKEENDFIFNNESNNNFEINTSSINNRSQDGIIELIKLKDLQNFFENINTQDLIASNKKNTNFVYIILLSGLLKFKNALLFMIKNNMYEDAINYYFFLKQIGIYNNFEEINDINILNYPKKKLNVNQSREEVYQIFPRVSQNIPALMLYIIYSDNNNFIQPLSYLILETESFYILNNYYQKVLLFKKEENRNKMREEKNKEKNAYNNIYNLNDDFNICLMDIIDENNLIKLCKNIFELLLTHKLKENSNLNPLFNTFKDLKMLTELTGILINKSIELLNIKKPIIVTDFTTGQFSINLTEEKNQKYFGYSLIMNYFGALINDVNQLFIEKQNERENLASMIKFNDNNDINEEIFLLSREIDDNKIQISLLKQLPIIETIYESIFKGEFEEAFKLFMENINLVKIGFDVDESEYLSEFNSFINDGLKKLKYGLIGLYPDILYLFVWVTKMVLNELYKKGYNNIIADMKNNCKALEYLLDRLVEISQNDQDLMRYATIFQKTQTEVNQIQQFYQQNNSII